MPYCLGSSAGSVLLPIHLQILESDVAIKQFTPSGLIIPGILVSRGAHAQLGLMSKMLHSLPKPWSRVTLAGAFKVGKLEMVKWSNDVIIFNNLEPLGNYRFQLLRASVLNRD